MLIWKNLLKKIKKIKRFKVITKNNKNDSAEKVAEMFEPYCGQGSAINYLNVSAKKNSPIINKNSPSFAEMGVKELFPHYLKHVLKVQENGLYEKIDKAIFEEMGLSSEDKANRLKNKAVKEKYLVATMERSKFEVNEENIRKYLENN